MAFGLPAWSLVTLFSAIGRPLRRAPAHRLPRTCQPPGMGQPAMDLGRLQMPTAAPSAVRLPALPVLPPERAVRVAQPVRVIVREQDARDGSCRLVISGRMADVCAELNRLVLH